MVYLLLAIASSAMIAIIMRISSRWVKGNISMLAVNYLTCLLLAAAYAGFQVFPLRTPGILTAIGMGGFNGIVYLAGFMLLQYNTAKNGVVLSSVFMKLGLLVPLVLSIFLFREIPTALQWVGFVLAVGAIILINYEKGAARAGSRLPLVLMLLAGGSGDAMSKVFEVYGPQLYANQFLFYTFASAFLLCAGLILRRAGGYSQFLFGKVLIDGIGASACSDRVSYLQRGHHPGGDPCRCLSVQRAAAPSPVGSTGDYPDGAGSFECLTKAHVFCKKHM